MTWRIYEAYQDYVPVLLLFNVLVQRKQIYDQLTKQDTSWFNNKTDLITTKTPKSQADAALVPPPRARPRPPSRDAHSPGCPCLFVLQAEADGVCINGDMLIFFATEVCEKFATPQYSRPCVGYAAYRSGTAFAGAVRTVGPPPWTWTRRRSNWIVSGPPSIWTSGAVSQLI
ncbi:unnamed protein product [Phytophthora lilii]|uniref:Unnamed protein product n=1 Tax=Phytophthora lilii TaxID=2077276 RepID=A0A9W6U798_9STRA|nr:unnamed protein product [Phytophthora lilii]